MEQSFTAELQNTLQKQSTVQKDDALKKNDSQSRLALSGLTTRSSFSGKAGEPSQVDMDMAISDMWDLQESIMFRFVIIGELAHAIHEKSPEYIGPIQVAMPRRYLTPEVESLFKTWNYTKEKYGYSYFFTPPIKWDIKIPVEIHVIERHYFFFDNPDVGFFGTNEFKLPNPFSAYWQVRNLIK